VSASVAGPENGFAVPFSAVTEVKGNPGRDICGLVVGSPVMLDHVLLVLMTVFMEIAPFFLVTFPVYVSSELFGEMK